MVGDSQADVGVEELKARIRQLEDELSALKSKRFKKDQGDTRATWHAPSKPRKTALYPWKAVVVVLFIFGSLFFSVAYWNYYSEKHSTRSVVIATVDDWRLYSGGGHGGIGGYSIKITLPDGSKASAKGHPLESKPPERGQKIRLVKIISGFGFTSYVWESPVLSFNDAVRDGVPSTYITGR